MARVIMNFGDQRFDCKSEFTKQLVKDIRAAASHPDTFDPTDLCMIFDVQYLMLTFAVLNDADLIRGCPKVAEAKEWLSRFKTNFTSWEEYEDYPGMLKAFENFVKVCEDNN